MTHRLVTPFKSWHYDFLFEDKKVTVALNDAMLDAMELGNSWSAVIDGNVIAIGGTVQQWRARHIAWAYLTPITGKHMRWITREALRAILRASGRIEMTVKTDFAAGHRWARLLGFSVETPVLKSFGPLGEDHTGYVRFN